MLVQIEIIEEYAGHSPGDRQRCNTQVAQRLIDAGLAVMVTDQAPDPDPAPSPAVMPDEYEDEDE